MNVVVLRGQLSSTPVRRQLTSGSVVLSLEVSTPTPAGTATVPAAWFDPPESAAFEQGDEVVVAGIVKRRFFRSGGGTQSRTEVVVADACPATNKRRAAKLVATAVSALECAE